MRRKERPISVHETIEHVLVCVSEGKNAPRCAGIYVQARCCLSELGALVPMLAPGTTISAFANTAHPLWGPSSCALNWVFHTRAKIQH